MVPEVVQLTKVGVCACGQLVAPGERAGYSPALDQVVCLSCLRALQGEPRQRFRVPRETFEVPPSNGEPTSTAPAAPAPAPPAEQVATAEQVTTTEQVAPAEPAPPTVPVAPAEKVAPAAPARPAAPAPPVAPAPPSETVALADSVAPGPIPPTPTATSAAPEEAPLVEDSTRASRRRPGRNGHQGEANSILGSLLGAVDSLPWRRSPTARTDGALDPMLDASPGIVVLHHRTLPGRRATIDHLVIGPAGVYVVESQDGPPLSVAVRRSAQDGASSQPQDDLLVGGHPQNHLLTALDARVQFVKEALAAQGLDEVPVVAVICFRRGMPALVDRRLMARETHIVAPKGLRRLVTTPGMLEAAHRRTLLGLFEEILPSVEGLESSSGHEPAWATSPLAQS